MAVKPGKYGQVYEKALASGKSASESHDIASKSASVKGGTVEKEKKKKKDWVGKLKEKVGIQTAAEKKRRLKLKVKTISGEQRLKAAGKKTTKELESEYKTVKAKKKKKKTTRTQQIDSGLKNAGLSDAEIKRLKGKK